MAGATAAVRCLRQYQRAAGGSVSLSGALLRPATMKPAAQGENLDRCKIKKPTDLVYFQACGQIDNGRGDGGDALPAAVSASRRWFGFTERALLRPATMKPAAQGENLDRCKIKKPTDLVYFQACGQFDNGRGTRTRTLGTWFWRPMLYQLSYTPSQILNYFTTESTHCQVFFWKTRRIF